MEKHKNFYKIVMPTMAVLLAATAIAIGERYLNGPQEAVTTVDDVENKGAILDPNAIVDGIHVRTGLVDGPGLTEVVNNCTTCHSAKLVTQNRMGKEQWNATIRWMQETQGLWDLGQNHEVIVDYLVTQYPPIKKGRRAPLTEIQWYHLK